MFRCAPALFAAVLGRAGVSVDLPESGSFQLLFHTGVVDPDWFGSSSYRRSLLVSGPSLGFGWQLP